MTEQEHITDSEFERRTKAVFRESVDGLDAATRSRLAQARYRALEELRQPTLMPSWVTANYRAVTAAIVVGVLAGWLMITGNQPPQTDLQMLAAADDIEFLFESEELEMLEELEFYAWLEEQPDLQIPAQPFNERSTDGAG